MSGSAKNRTQGDSCVGKSRDNDHEWFLTETHFIFFWYNLQEELRKQVSPLSSFLRPGSLTANNGSVRLGVSWLSMTPLFLFERLFIMNFPLLWRQLFARFNIFLCHSFSFEWHWVVFGRLSLPWRLLLWKQPYKKDTIVYWSGKQQQLFTCEYRRVAQLLILPESITHCWIIYQLRQNPKFQRKNWFLRFCEHANR